MFCTAGHIDCIAFALEHPHGRGVAGFELAAAVTGGHLACIKLMVAHANPERPLILAETKCARNEDPARPRIRGPAGPAQLRCVQHILDAGLSIHTGTLILAARNGDLDYVRFLHSRGVRLWDHAQEEEPEDFGTSCFSCKCLAHQAERCAERNAIALPCKPEDASHMLSALRYGWAMGAPLTPVMEEVLAAQRMSTHAVLLCFHVATGLSQGEGSVEQRAAWSAMGRVPMELIEEILILAELEIPELLHRGLPGN
jgi:hypothetical protein